MGYSVVGKCYFDYIAKLSKNGTPPPVKWYITCPTQKSLIVLNLINDVVSLALNWTHSLNLINDVMSHLLYGTILCAMFTVQLF